MNMNDLLTITHTGDEYEKYLGAVVPPIFMNSLHVFPDFESYLNFDDYKEDSFIYGRESNPTAHIMERTEPWPSPSLPAWPPAQLPSWPPAAQAAISSACTTLTGL